MAKARVEAEVIGFEEGARKLGQVDQAVWGLINEPRTYKSSPRYLALAQFCCVRGLVR